jgi:predicted RNase H-like nuclease
LLYEYFVRLIKLFNEPKVASHQESSEMQEIMEKISNLMQKECLKFDDESDEEKGSKNKE